MSASKYMTSDEIERDVETTRADVGRTLEELRDRMSPGQMLDEALSFARDNGGGDFTRNLGTQVRDNPLPVVLIGAGIAWLLAGRGPSARGIGHLASQVRNPLAGHRTDAMARGMSAAAAPGYRNGNGNGRHFDESGYAATARDTLGGVASSVSGAAGKVASAVGSGAAGVRDTVSSATSGISSAASSAGSGLNEGARMASGAYGSVRDGANVAYDAAGNAYSTARHGLADAAGYVGGSAQEAARYARSAQKSLVQLIEEQPLLVGTIGLAIGAILGSSLPATRTENRLMGDSADRAKESLGETARHGAIAAVDAVERTYDAVKAEAEAQGIDRETIKDGVRDIGDKVSAVLTTAKEAAKDEIAGAKEELQANAAKAGTDSGEAKAGKDVPSKAKAGAQAPGAGL